MLRCGRVSGVAFLLLAMVASGSKVLGQDKPDAPTPKMATAASQQPAASGQNPSASTDPNAPQDDNPKRILGIIPNFQTTNDTPAVQEPMTAREKYVLAWHQTVDISAHFGNLFQA